MIKVDELPLGSIVEFGAFCHTSGEMRDLLWQKVSRNNDFMARHILQGSFCFDCPEPNNKNEARQNHGSNFYPHSNLLQYLNAAGDDWFEPQGDTDVLNEGRHSFLGHGFLKYFTQEELDLMIPVTVKGAVPFGSRSEFGKTYEVTRKVHLPSDIEITGRKLFDAHEDVGGQQFDHFRHSVSPIHYAGVITRTPHNKSVCALAVLDSYGVLRAVTADRNVNVQPVIRLSGNLEVQSDSDRSFGQNVYVSIGTGRSVEDGDLARILAGAI